MVAAPLPVEGNIGWGLPKPPHHGRRLTDTLLGYSIWRMREQVKTSCTQRLNRIEGQVRGIARMIEQDRYCIDVLTQIRAVRAALDKVEQETLGDHLRHCVADAFHGGSVNERQTKIDELLEVLENRRR